MKKNILVLLLSITTLIQSGEKPLSLELSSSLETALGYVKDVFRFESTRKGNQILGSLIKRDGKDEKVLKFSYINFDGKTKDVLHVSSDQCIIEVYEKDQAFELTGEALFDHIEEEFKSLSRDFKILTPYKVQDGMHRITISVIR